jgi:hypothetical protein
MTILVAVQSKKIIINWLEVQPSLEKILATNNIPEEDHCQKSCSLRLSEYVLIRKKAKINLEHWKVETILEKQ